MGKSNFLFSIVLPTYNRAHSIGKAIKSIINQSYINWELIIIDDGSRDNTEEVVSSFCKTDGRIQYIKQENSERCIARNNGIKIAKGEWICFLDSDDYHLPNHLDTIFNYINNNSINKGFIFTNAWDETEDGKRTERFCPNYEDFEPYTYFLRYTVNPQRWAVHKSIFNNIKFDSEIIIAEDMDTSLRILESGAKVFQIKERTTVYVAAVDSFTKSDSKKSEKELFYFKKIFRKPELKNHLPSKECNRLLSMCYFHISLKSKGLKSIYKGLYSFILYPAGYNGKTNKILFVNCIYNIPLIGFITQKIVRILKHE